MKALSFSVPAACAMLLVGCSVEIAPSSAVAQLATSADIQNDAEASASEPSGVGAWVLLTAVINKKVVQRVSRWQVYPNVYVVECGTRREMNVGTAPRLEGTGFGSANGVKALVKDHPAKQTYVMRSLIFSREGDFQTPQCLQFRGGSYLGQKIAEKAFPIHISGQLP
jgi:hypothetical protein